MRGHAELQAAFGPDDIVEPVDGGALGHAPGPDQGMLVAAGKIYDRTGGVGADASRVELQ